MSKPADFPYAGVLERLDPQVDADAAARLALTAFGVAARTEKLTGERDQNFRVQPLDGGAARLLKISNSAEDPAIADLQTQALLHIADHAPHIPTPRVYPALDGAHAAPWRNSAGALCTVRLLSFLDGEPLSALPGSLALARSVGAALAAFNNAVSAFRHSAEDHDLLWDLQRADRVAAIAETLPDAERRELARAGLAVFSERAAARLPSLPVQLIHNDLNPHNILINRRTGTVSGIIDLGDAVRAPRINDVAVAAAYHVGADRDPLAGIEALLEGYVGVLPLRVEEVEVLLALVVGRLAMSVAISSWRAEKDPANRAYIVRNLPAALAGLERLVALDFHAATTRLCAAARNASP